MQKEITKVRDGDFIVVLFLKKIESTLQIKKLVFTMTSKSDKTMISFLIDIQSIINDRKNRYTWKKRTEKTMFFKNAFAEQENNEDILFIFSFVLLFIYF